MEAYHLTICDIYPFLNVWIQKTKKLEQTSVNSILSWSQEQ